MIEIIREKEAWDKLVGACAHSDFYHTYDYHRLSKADDEVPILLNYNEKGESIIFPLLIRHIAGTSHTDATSVYGYPGPLTSGLSKNFDNTHFKEEFQTLFLENNIISIFSRLNPLIPLQELILRGQGEIVTSGKIVNIDLTQSLQDQESNYQKRLRTSINKARRLCTVKKATTEEEIVTFIEMYYENMRRVKAKKFYFFEYDYFFDLLKSTRFKAEILLTVHNDSCEIIGGALFVKKSNIVQYHLSGTREEFTYLNPVKLMIDEMRIRATHENYAYFNIGGGVGGKEDSLFQFKSHFSKDHKPFKTWKYVLNEKIYQELVEEKQSRGCAVLHKECSEFFPCYRCDI